MLIRHNLSHGLMMWLCFKMWICLKMPILQSKRLYCHCFKVTQYWNAQWTARVKWREVKMMPETTAQKRWLTHWHIILTKRISSVLFPNRKKVHLYQSLHSEILRCQSSVHPIQPTMPLLRRTDMLPTLSFLIKPLQYSPSWTVQWVEYTKIYWIYV